MGNRMDRSGMQVDALLVDFVEQQALPGTGIEAAVFWDRLSQMAHEFGPRNAALLEKRESLQAQIDDWHKARKGQPHDHTAYKAFLTEIGYLVPEGGDFQIETANVDPEFTSVPGPQLVVPITNARYALNAANARWGSLYDGLYGTDAMGSLPPAGGFERGRGARVVARARVFLDEAFPVEGLSHSDATRYHVEDGALLVNDKPLIAPEKFVGYKGHPKAPDAVLLRNNGLHVELVFDRTHNIGARDQAGLADVRLESAVSAIMDCEDSVACVDGEEKVQAYANWLGLMKGDLSETFEKRGQTLTRALNGDLDYVAPDGSALSVKGRALMLVRNVGHLMTNPAILLKDGSEIFEGLMDAMITVLIAKHDLSKTGGLRNSHTGSVYVVKPKMHGPEEVAFADEIFSFVEKALGLPQYTVKLGIMDEERRTSVNLKECIRAAKNRVAFINTGFLDRTGDEIHTSMEAGPFSRKDFIKRKAWITAYEALNVDIGLECGLSGRAQIGKGMWAMPDKMAAMLDAKIDHPRSGANCAWVPSPTAATLHALHYHRVDVFGVQKGLLKGGRRAHVDQILDIPLATYRKWTPAQITAEVENNAQGILGYVVRWIDQGVGCSKVPDIHDVGLMEDRATCRISSQHIANWLHHGVVSRDEVMEIMQRMAEVVDRQNAGDAGYTPMAPGFDGIAFKAACELVFEGRVQPSGYTEPVLHRRRLELKAQG
ncbi:malate synthase G [Tropicibacter naphthalenivorans]|uniref:Malate synthase G n=1 Tax=Tropicibacter naphthalenivorans TaxID=441103 RepID=A0A0P1GEU9_9RHOB|nr:malate synthase G [Tropicibacter naphthalenivorans]CUH80034.1 Malate synthase G [Tropicibacter naphthalenivorans]SMC83587.1 malate synthase [Tropicibacter naphthalenivorans]